MLGKLIDQQGNVLEIEFYKIQNLCEVMVDAAINNSRVLRVEFEDEYLSRMTRFSPEFEFCLHRLGWMLYDPYCLGKDEVLFSNGERSYVANSEFVKQEGFNRFAVKNDKVGYARLTDELIKYDDSLNKINDYTVGIVDEEGYVDAGFVSNVVNLADVIVMSKLIQDESFFKEYVRDGKNYANSLLFLLSRKNTLVVRHLSDGKFQMKGDKESTGMIRNFVDKLEIMGLINDTVGAENVDRKMIA